MQKIIFSFLLFLSFIGIAQQNDVASNKYWTQGKAEVNVYELSQNRYKENHPGHLVSVFVTEDFLTEKQVKNEYYQDTKSTWILKNIQLRKFNTGVYDYSLFTSTFTPIDRTKFSKSLKVSASSQEWCGTIFTQFNLINAYDYKVEQRSYFEKEGDFNNRIKRSFLEDEVFNIIRMNPAFLEKGRFRMIPPANYIQLKHIQSRTYEVFGGIRTYKGKEFQGEKLNEYKLEYPALKRTVRIVYENKAPYKIVGWLDSFPSSFDQKIRTTKVTLKKQKMLPYWGQNSLNDASLRKELGLK
jgi:hypothetical protein